MAAKFGPYAYVCVQHLQWNQRAITLVNMLNIAVSPMDGVVVAVVVISLSENMEHIG